MNKSMKLLFETNSVKKVKSNAWMNRITSIQPSHQGKLMCM